MCLKCDKAMILDSNGYKAPDYKGDEVDWVDYVYRKENPIPIPVGVTVTKESYTKTMPDGTKVSTIHGIPKFHQINGDWYELEYRTVRKEDWDVANVIGVDL